MTERTGKKEGLSIAELIQKNSRGDGPALAEMNLVVISKRLSLRVEETVEDAGAGGLVLCNSMVVLSSRFKVWRNKCSGYPGAQPSV